MGCSDFGLVRIAKVMGHAGEGMVRDGGVREQDRVGNNAADEAADFGRWMVDFLVIDARRIFSSVCGSTVFEEQNCEAWVSPLIDEKLAQFSPGNPISCSCISRLRLWDEFLACSA